MTKSKTGVRLIISPISSAFGRPARGGVQSTLITTMIFSGLTRISQPLVPKSEKSDEVSKD